MNARTGRRGTDKRRLPDLPSLPDPRELIDRAMDAFLALCLGRETCRVFRLNRCTDIDLVPSADVVAPVPIREIIQEGIA